MVLVELGLTQKALSFGKAGLGALVLVCGEPHIAAFKRKKADDIQGVEHADDDAVELDGPQHWDVVLDLISNPLEEANRVFLVLRESESLRMHVVRDVLGLLAAA